MNTVLNLKQMSNTLDALDMRYRVLQLNDNATILVTQHGGRIFGPFIGDDEGILWANECFMNPQRLREFITSGAWNIGGDRIWLAPELDFNVPDRNNFDESYDLPATIDPGNYEFGDKKGVSLLQLMLLNRPSTKILELNRQILPTENPLECEGFCCGYRHLIELCDHNANHQSCEVWNLTQVKPHGYCYIPCNSSPVITDYYEPANEYFTNEENVGIAKITGDRRYKIGVKAICTTGRVLYISRISDDQFLLMVKIFDSDPTTIYTKEPAGKPGQSGHSFHIYNDNLMNGGFAELEFSGRTIGGVSGINKTIDVMSTLFYKASAEEISNIAEMFSGIKIKLQGE